MRNKRSLQERNTVIGSTKPSSKALFIFMFMIVVIGLNMPSCSFFSNLIDSEPTQYFSIQSEDGSGIMDCTGKWIVEPVEQGHVIGPMVDGLAPFNNLQSTKAETYINQDGEFPFDEKFDRAMPFSEGLAAVLVDGKWGYIDTTGAFVIRPRFAGNQTGNFNDGLANVPIEVNELLFVQSWIFIDTKGEKVLGPFRAARSFSNGYAAVVSLGEDRKVGFINPEGEFVLELTDGYFPAGDYSEGLFPVRDIALQTLEGKCSIGFMDKEGEWVIEPEYCQVGTFSNGLAPVSRSTDLIGSIGYINTSGDMVIDENYDFATTFSGGCARVAWDGLRSFGLIDTKGNFIYRYEQGK